MLLTSVPAGIAVALGAVFGQVATAGLIGSIPVAFLILWRPEIGLFLLVFLTPFEGFARFGEAFTLTKAIGLFTLPVALVHMAMRRQGTLRNAALWLAMGFASWALLSILSARSPELAWFSWLTRIQLVGLFFLTISVCWGGAQVKTLIWMIALGAALAGLAGFFLTPAPEYEQMVRRIRVGGGDVNEFAKTLQGGIFLVPWLFTQCRRRGKVFLVVLLLVTLTAIVTTGSRSVYISLFLGMVVGLLSYRGAALPTRLGLVVAASAGLGGFLALGWFAGLWEGGLWDRVIQLWEQGLATGGRLWIWTHGLKMGAENPLLGVGIGNYHLRMLQYGSAHSAHNDLISHFAETGVPGFLLYVGFLVAVLWQLLKTWPASLRAGLVGLFVSANVASLANPSHGMKMFWVQMAVCCLGGMHYGARGQGAPASADGPAPNASTVSPLLSDPASGSAHGFTRSP